MQQKFDDRKKHSFDLKAEKLSLSLSKKPGDTVKVSIKTREEAELIEQNLIHENVEIEHFAIGRVVDSVPSIRKENGVTIISVVEEVAVVEKRLILKEEIHIRQVQVAETYREKVMLRKQDAIIDRIKPDLQQNFESDEGAYLQPNQPCAGDNKMYAETIVGIYDTKEHAEAAITELKQAGVPADTISEDLNTFASAKPARDRGFWASVFGGDLDHHDSDVYDRSVAQGSIIVTVKAEQPYVDRITSILEKHNPIDIDERASSLGLNGRSSSISSSSYLAKTGSETLGARLPDNVETPLAEANFVPNAPSDSNTIELAEERLAVGKRLINRGGTRIRRFVVETPAEQEITLRDEYVILDRHPVDGRAVATPDFADKTIEMTESFEEAVVAKTAHVVEKISLRKEASDRVETVRDTLRREDVEIEKIAGDLLETKLEPVPSHSKI